MMMMTTIGTAIAAAVADSPSLLFLDFFDAGAGVESWTGAAAGAKGAADGAVDGVYARLGTVGCCAG